MWSDETLFVKDAVLRMLSRHRPFDHFLDRIGLMAGHGIGEVVRGVVLRDQAGDVPTPTEMSLS